MLLKARVNNVYTLQKEWCFIIFQNYVLSFWITISLVSKMATSACKCCGVHKQQPWSDIAFWKILIGSRVPIFVNIIDVVSYVHFSSCILNVSEFHLNVCECFAQLIPKGEISQLTWKLKLQKETNANKIFADWHPFLVALPLCTTYYKFLEVIISLFTCTLSKNEMLKLNF